MPAQRAGLMSPEDNGVPSTIPTDTCEHSTMPLEGGQLLLEGGQLLLEQFNFYLLAKVNHLSKVGDRACAYVEWTLEIYRL